MTIYEQIRTAKIGDVLEVENRKGIVTESDGSLVDCYYCICNAVEYKTCEPGELGHCACQREVRHDGQEIYIKPVE